MAQQHTSVVRAGHSNWLIGGIAGMAIIGLAVALFTAIHSNDQLRRDEECLRSVVAAQTARSAALSPLSTRRDAVDALRTDAANRRQNAADAEQQQQAIEQGLFLAAFNEHPAGRQQRRLQKRFVAAASRYVAAAGRYRKAKRQYVALDLRWHHLDDLYNQASQAHPVPVLHCGDLAQPSPVVHVTATATMHDTTTAHATSTATAHATATRTRVVVVPGPTRTVVRVHSVTRTETRTSTVTVPPGHRKGHR